MKPNMVALFIYIFNKCEHLSKVKLLHLIYVDSKLEENIHNYHIVVLYQIWVTHCKPPLYLFSVHCTNSEIIRPIEIYTMINLSNVLEKTSIIAHICFTAAPHLNENSVKGPMHYNTKMSLIDKTRPNS